MGIRLQFAAFVLMVCCMGSSCAQGASSQSGSPQNAKPANPPAAQSAEAPAPVKVSDAEMKELFVKRVRPLYPKLAEQAHITGRVRLRMVIRADGQLREIQIVFGHPMLAPSAIEAAKASKYRAYIVDGHPVAAEGEVEYEIY